jgi:hypothetical protein
MSTSPFTDRVAWREAVQAVADKAHAKLPECNGRVDSAVKLVLAGDVELLADGTAKVASRSNGAVTYHIANGHCDCRDYEQAPHNLCAHRLAYGIARRATEQTPPAPAPLRLPPPLPEAPASANCYIMLEGRQVQVTLRDTDETRLLMRLTALLQQYPTPEPSTQEKDKGEGWCSTHNVPMKLNHGKDGRTWHSHKTPEGQWCKGKGVQRE